MSIDLNNDKFEQSMEPLRKIGETINNMQAPLRQIAENVRIANQALVAAVQSDVVQNVLQFGQSIAKLVASYDFTPMLKKFSEAMIPIKYIDLLERLKWPVFLIDDEDLRNKILLACNDQEDADAVREIIFDYCSNEFLEAMEQDWNTCPALKEMRKPILLEAMQLHKSGFYYASTSMLMCQVYGVASDIVDIAKKHNLNLDNDMKDFVSEHFDIKPEDIDKEKGKLMQMVAMTESGILLWDAMAGYLKNEILCSSDSKQRWATQPLRNKICHGDQLNFGTQEHSLKAILTVDMLIQLAYEINRIAELQSNAIVVSEEQENGIIRCDEGCDQPCTEG